MPEACNTCRVNSLRDTQTDLLPASASNPNAARAVQIVGDPEIAWIRYDIDGDETLTVVRASTNDDLDRGYPTESAAWDHEYRAHEDSTALGQALGQTGRSRFAVGHVVLVVLDEQPI